MAYIEDNMLKQGPFDGMLGVSQGVLIAAESPGMQSEGGKFGGSVFSSPELAKNAFSSPIEISSPHFIGEHDFAKENGLELLEAFVDPTVIYHHEGHGVPHLVEEDDGTTRRRRRERKTEADQRSSGSSGQDPNPKPDPKVEVRGDGSNGEQLADIYSDEREESYKSPNRSKKSVRWSEELVMESPSQTPMPQDDRSNPYVAYAPAPSDSASSSFNFKNTMYSVRDVLGRWGTKVGEATKKAEDLAGNTWQHCKISDHL
ncbi:unnamed protein product, partial [Ilex paraguariensis]